MNMIERVTKAMMEADCKQYEDKYPNLARTGSIRRSCENLKEDYLVMARAAIEAMREPTPHMKNVVSKNWGRRTWSEYDDVIDAALDT